MEVMKKILRIGRVTIAAIQSFISQFYFSFQGSTNSGSRKFAVSPADVNSLLPWFKHNVLVIEKHIVTKNFFEIVLAY